MRKHEEDRCDISEKSALRVTTGRRENGKAKDYKDVIIADVAICDELYV